MPKRRFSRERVLAVCGGQLLPSTGVLPLPLPLPPPADAACCTHNEMAVWESVRSGSPQEQLRAKPRQLSSRAPPPHSDDGDRKEGVAAPV